MKAAGTGRWNEMYPNAQAHVIWNKPTTDKQRAVHEAAIQTIEGELRDLNFIASQHRTCP
jgi:hypothetical protein